tara:strand:+ start:3416 stop:4138 length:723 start_codon:yes stop_codon:yes gene_type:complete
MNPNISNPFAPYKDSHAGTTAILCGSGPTLLEFDASLVPEGVLRFGVNDQIFLDLDLDYWFMGDSVPQVPDKFWNRYRDFNDYQPKKQKFVRFCNWEDDREVIIQPFGRVPRNGQLPLNLKNSKYYISDSGGNPDHCKFKKNIAEGNLTSVASITFEVLQFMLYCGIKKIFLVGQDCDYSGGTFAKIMIGKQQRADYYILRYWTHVKEWITQNYPDVELYSINPVALNIFPEAQIEDIKC